MRLGYEKHVRSRLILLVLLALAACGNADPDLAERLSCAPAEGIDAVLDAPSSTHVLIDGEAAEPAASAILCAAAARGERVGFGATDHGAREQARRMSGQGAAIEVFTFETGPAPAGAERRPAEVRDQLVGEARNAAFAGQVRAHAANADRMILALDAPDASRGRVGLSGNTWRPLGALLPAERVLSLRAERGSRPGVNIRLIPFEDVPVRGAALRYDGIVEVGPPAQQAGARSSTAPRAR